MIIVAFLCFVGVCVSKQWVEGFVFDDPEYSFQLARILAYSYQGGSALGESIQTSMRINESEPHVRQQWYNEWLKTGNYLLNDSNTWHMYGYDVSAHEGYERASNYIRMSGFFLVDGDEEWKTQISTFQQSQDVFQKVVDYYPHLSILSIPTSWDVPIRGYYMKQNTEEKVPLLIAHSGFDGCAMELQYEVGKDAYKRGYNVLTFDGPGQGDQLFLHNVTFRPDWENVVKPVVDYVEQHLSDSVDMSKIALMGRSMGGYLAPRAATKEKRLAAVIANGGIYDFSMDIWADFPPKLADLIYTNPSEFDAIIDKYVLPEDLTAFWFFKSGPRRFGTPDYASLMLALKEYTLNGTVQEITCPVLVMDSSEDTMVPGQAKLLYEKLTCEKDYMLFTEKLGAQSHCQIGDIGYSNERAMNWLDNLFSSMG